MGCLPKPLKALALGLVWGWFCVSQTQEVAAVLMPDGTRIDPKKYGIARHIKGLIKRRRFPKSILVYNADFAPVHEAHVRALFDGITTLRHMSVCESKGGCDNGDIWAFLA